MRNEILMAAMVVGVCAVAEGRAQGWVDRTTATGPAPSSSNCMCYDPVRGYVMLATNVSSGAQIWTWDGSAWTPRAVPLMRGITSLVWHASTSQLLALGYETSSFGLLPAFQAWDGQTWTPQPTPPSLPSTNVGFDPVRQETVLYTGTSSVAVWDGSTWFTRSVSLPAVPLQAASGGMSFDPIANRLVLVGQSSFSSGGSSVYQPYFFEWSGSGWIQRLPAQRPDWPGAIATDTLRQRVVLFDGDWLNLQPNHTWTLQNGVLLRLSLSVEPMLRRNAAMAFDPVRGKCVLFGGMNPSGASLGDTWEFDLGPVASFGTFGSGCSGSRGVPSLAALSGSVPRVGTTFQARVSNLPWTGAAFLALGLSNTTYTTTPLPLDLGFLGAPGCSLLTSIEEVQPLVNVLARHRHLVVPSAAAGRAAVLHAGAAARSQRQPAGLQCQQRRRGRDRPVGRRSLSCVKLFPAGEP